MKKKSKREDKFIDVIKHWAEQKSSEHMKEHIKGFTMKKKINSLYVGERVILVTPSSYLVLFSCGSQNTLVNQWVPLPDLGMGKLRNTGGISHT